MESLKQNKKRKDRVSLDNEEEQVANEDMDMKDTNQQE